MQTMKYRQGADAESPSCRRHRNRRSLKLIALAAACLFVLVSCIPPFGSSDTTGPLQLKVNEADIRLAWDHSPGRKPETMASITHFRLYFRERGTRDWTRIAEIRARENPVFMVSADAVLGSRSSRKVEFGVSSINNGGNESKIHASTDFEARPHGGWYVHWTKP